MIGGSDYDGSLVEVIEGWFVAVIDGSFGIVDEDQFSLLMDNMPEMNAIIGYWFVNGLLSIQKKT